MEFGSSRALLRGAQGAGRRGVRSRAALAALVGLTGCLALLAAAWTGGGGDAQALLADSWASNMRGDAGGPAAGGAGARNPSVTSMADVNRVVSAASDWLARREAALQRAGAAPQTALRARTLKLSEGDMDEFLVSDFFEFLSRNCCRSLYFPKEAQQALPQALPGGVNGEFAQRLRDFVGMRNSLIFNGADANTAAFVNTYFGLHLAPTDVTSGFQMRKSYEIAGDHSSPLSYPEKLEEELPQKLEPAEGMTAFDTATLPAATAVVYNNFPRTPTGSPMFIMKYCQIENPYVQDGTRITVSPPDCAAAAKDLGSECSCGKIALVGWDWEKAADNIWDTSTINAQVLAEYMGAGGKPSEMKAPSAPSRASLAKTPVVAAGSAASAASARGTGTGTGGTQMKARAPAKGAEALPEDKRQAYKPLTRTDRYAMNIAGKTNRLAFAGRAGSDKVPATVVDRMPQGPPTWGIDSLNRDVIPEWEKQDDKYAFWGREGGWRNICGPRQHPMWDPQQKKFYTMKVGQASNYVKHWCTCMPSGNIEIETKQGADTMGCEDMYPAGSNMKSVSVSPGGDERHMGRGADVYETTAPGYKYQRVMDRHDDLRWDERYPSFVAGNGGDRGIWMDENDAGPPPIIDDYAKGKLWAPKRQELMKPDEQGALPLNAREAVYNDPANMVLPWDKPRASNVRQYHRGLVKAKSAAPRATLSSSGAGSATATTSTTSADAMWKDDVDVLEDVNSGEAEASEGAGDRGDAGEAADANEKRTPRHQKVVVDAWGRPLNHWPTSKDYPTGSGDYDAPVPQAPPGQKNARAPAATRSEIARESAARASALQAAADAAGALALAAKDKVGGALLERLEKTAADAEAAVGDGQKLHHDEYETMPNSERKLPWREGTRGFHNHMNGRVHPRIAHPQEDVDIRGKHIKTSERPTPFTGWGLQRDRFGRATEIGYVRVRVRPLSALLAFVRVFSARTGMTVCVCVSLFE